MATARSPLINSDKRATDFTLYKELTASCASARREARIVPPATLPVDRLASPLDILGCDHTTVRPSRSATPSVTTEGGQDTPSTPVHERLRRDDEGRGADDARHQQKAAKAGVDVVLHTGIVEALPFPDAHFDAVVGTLLLHHFPRPVREQCAREMRRKLKPGGRVLAVDFATPARERRGLFARFQRHGHVALRDIVALLTDAARRFIAGLWCDSRPLFLLETGRVGYCTHGASRAAVGIWHPRPEYERRSGPA